jgi:hypothetical protein
MQMSHEVTHAGLERRAAARQSAQAQARRSFGDRHRLQVLLRERVGGDLLWKQADDVAAGDDRQQTQRGVDQCAGRGRREAVDEVNLAPQGGLMRGFVPSGFAKPISMEQK